MKKQPYGEQNPDKLAGRLYQARKAKGLTQKSLGDLVGSSQAVIQKIENGKSLQPRLELLQRIAEALETTPYFLLFGVVDTRELTSESAELIQIFNKLAPSGQQAVLALVRLYVNPPNDG